MAATPALSPTTSKSSLLYSVSRTESGPAPLPSRCRIFCPMASTASRRKAFNLRGRHPFYGAARDRQRNSSGWQIIGQHNLSARFPPTPPTLPPLAPARTVDSPFPTTIAIPLPATPRSTRFKLAQVRIQNTLDARRAAEPRPAPPTPAGKCSASSLYLDDEVNYY